jgi:hypothetical protein
MMEFLGWISNRRRTYVKAEPSWMEKIVTNWRKIAEHRVTEHRFYVLIVHVICPIL